jgi:5-methylcytosine-specific restriction endonuclease McrA
MNARYLRFIRSPEWKRLRAEVLARDEYRCQVWLEHEATEVHHRTYQRFGGREHAADLISLCRACHKAITNVIRAERHHARKLLVRPMERLTPAVLHDAMQQALTVAPVIRLTPAMERTDRGLQDLIVSPQRRITPVDAPRRVS